MLTGQRRDAGEEGVVYGAGVDVELRVPAHQVVDAPRQAVEVVEIRRAAAGHVEAHRAHARPVQPLDLPVARVHGDLCDTHEARPEGREGIHEIALVEGLEGPGDHGPALDVQLRGAIAVVRHRERVRQEAVVLHEGVGGVDDVQMGVEQALDHAGLLRSGAVLRGSERGGTGRGPGC